MPPPPEQQQRPSVVSISDDGKELTIMVEVSRRRGACKAVIPRDCTLADVEIFAGELARIVAEKRKPEK